MALSNPLGGMITKGKSVPKNTWFILLALGVGYLLYRNIHRDR